MGGYFELNDGLPRGCTPRLVHCHYYNHYHLYFFLFRFFKNNLEHQMSCVRRLEGGLDTTALWQRPER